MKRSNGLRRKRRVRLGSYAALLIAMVAYLVVASVVQETGGRIPWITALLFPVILFTTVGSATEERRQLAGLILLALSGIAADIVNARVDGLGVEVTAHLVHIIFLVLTILVILRHVLRSAVVGPDMILGAVCAYLLLGFAFNQVYSFVEAIQPGSFAGAIGMQQDGGYFSLVTLSTLGYGDRVPARPLARSIAAVEAVVGQFYIAVIVARLVAMQVIHSLPSADDASQEREPSSR